MKKHFLIFKILSSKRGLIFYGTKVNFLLIARLNFLNKIPLF